MDMKWILEDHSVGQLVEILKAKDLFHLVKDRLIILLTFHERHSGDDEVCDASTTIDDSPKKRRRESITPSDSESNSPVPKLSKFLLYTAKSCTKCLPDMPPGASSKKQRVDDGIRHWQGDLDQGCNASTAVDPNPLAAGAPVSVGHPDGRNTIGKGQPLPHMQSLSVPDLLTRAAS
jgi:hypothetical protein